MRKEDNTIAISLIYGTKIHEMNGVEFSFVVSRGVWGGKEWEFGISRDKQRYMEWISNNITTI